LLEALKRAGVRALGMKPVAAGIDADATLNDDVRALVAASGLSSDSRSINPYAFVPAVAPHLAAAAVGDSIKLSRIVEAYGELSRSADVVIVEGAGGALVPLTDRDDMLDIAAELRLPLLLVVGVRLGCLNHARLTALAIRLRGLECIGWVANRIDPAMVLAEENVATLRDALPAPLIGDVGWNQPARFGVAALRTLRLIDA